MARVPSGVPRQQKIEVNINPRSVHPQTLGLQRASVGQQSSSLPERSSWPQAPVRHNRQQTQSRPKVNIFLSQPNYRRPFNAQKLGKYLITGPEMRTRERALHSHNPKRHRP